MGGFGVGSRGRLGKSAPFLGRLSWRERGPFRTFCTSRCGKDCSGGHEFCWLGVLEAKRIDFVTEMLVAWGCKSSGDPVIYYGPQ